MPYIGKQPITGNFIKLDTISVVNGQAAYTMQKDSVNFSPGSANQMLVSLNGIIQSPSSSFTISGSTITFASNLVTGDVINFILVLGDVLNVGTVSDNTITNDKLATAPTLISKGAGSDSGAIQLNCEQNTHGVKIKGPPHSASQSYTLTLPSTAPSADKALITDGSGNLSFGSAGGLVKLFSQSNVSAQSSYDIGSTYINSTYDDYYFILKGTLSATANLYARFFTSGTVVTTDYGYTLARMDENNYYIDVDGATEMRMFQGYVTATGGFILEGLITNVNDTALATGMLYKVLKLYNTTNVRGETGVAGQDGTKWGTTVNGIRFYANSGNIAINNFNLFGVVK